MLLQELLNIELPIIQAPMAGAQDHRLCVAVSNAGGLGSLPAAMLSGDVLTEEVAAIKKLTSQAYNLNFFCHAEPGDNQEQFKAWRTTLDRYYREFEVDESNLPAGPRRKSFDSAAADIVEHIKPPVVSFHFGLPDKTLLDRVKGAGAKILSTATSVTEGLYLQEQGVDAIIAQGLEAGGHRGNFLSDDLSLQTKTMDLVQQLVSRLDLPIVAAGGISNSALVKKAMSLGAAGVQIGTAYLLCPEMKIKDIHRAALSDGEMQETALTNLFSGRPARGIVNRLMNEIGPLREGLPEFPLAGDGLLPLRSILEAKGRSDFTPMWSGENFPEPEFHDLTAAEITRRLMS